MPEEFRDIIAALWETLGLPRPRFRQEEAAATLTVDGIVIAIIPSGDRRHITVSAKAGQLSANPVAMDEQVACLLKASLLALPQSRACICLDDQDSPAPSVMVKAIIPFHSYGTARVMDRLVQAISDVACLAREHGRMLGSASAPHERLNEETTGDMVVFRL
jgi:hypothetical protein